jgi:uncharacterized delta-60 repeat protein
MVGTMRAIGVLTALAVTVGSCQALAAPGDLDRSFGNGGKVRWDRSWRDKIVDVVTQADGKVLALIETGRRPDDNAGERVSAIVRFHSGGRIDRRFGQDGIAPIRPATRTSAGGLALDPRGRIVAAYTHDPYGAGNESLGVARFRPRGRPDKSFDSDGIQAIGFGPGLESPRAHDVAVGPTGEVVVAGQVTDFSATYVDFSVVKLTENGDLDDTFSGDGRVTHGFADDYERDEALGVAMDSGGRIVAVGFTSTGIVESLAVARYRTDGSLDDSFAGDGRLVSSFGNRGNAVMAGDRITVAGAGSKDFLVARYLPDGSPDAAFSEDGAAYVDFADLPDKALDLAASGGGRVVVAGTARATRSRSDFGVARLDADGSLDRRFSDDGSRRIDFSRGRDAAAAVAIDAAGSVVLGGMTRRTGADGALAKLDGRSSRSR